VEIMVALVIGILVIGVVFQFVMGQTRFASTQATREEVQQNLRGALDIVSGELRGAVPQGIVRAEARAIEFQMPQRWGVVCAVTGTTVTVAAFPNNGLGVPATGERFGLIARAAPGDWRPLATQARATVTGVTTLAAADCAGVQVQGDVVVYRFTGANHPNVLPGSPIAYYDRVTYEVGERRGRQWLLRSNGYSGGRPVMEPLAGPVDAGEDGVRFRYFAAVPPAAPAEIAPPLGAAATANIRLVRFAVRTTSRQGTGPELTRHDSATVQIRN
jgi:hypothetical protein